MFWSDIGWLRWPVTTAVVGAACPCVGAACSVETASLLCSVVFCRVLTDILVVTVESLCS